MVDPRYATKKQHILGYAPHRVIPGYLLLNWDMHAQTETIYSDQIVLPKFQDIHAYP